MLKVIDEVALGIACKAKMQADKLKRRARRKENGDQNILVIMIICVIAVAFCIIFRDRLGQIVDMVTGNALTRVTEIINGTTNPTP